MVPGDLLEESWDRVRPALVSAASTTIEELDVLVPKAVGGDPFVIREYVASYRRLLRNLIGRVREIQTSGREISVALIEHGAMNAPFSPWVIVAGPGLGVAVYALSDIRRMVGEGVPELPQAVADFPDWGLEDSGIRHFMRTVWKALQQSEHPLQQIADAFGLNLTQLGTLFGVSRQAVSQWFLDEIPSSRRAKVATVSEVVDLLRRKLKEDRLPGIARRPAETYGGVSMLDLIKTDRHMELLQDVRNSFDWSATA